jgi:transposase
LESLPGRQETAARVMLAEIGTDMRRFDAAARLAASLCRFPPPWLAHSPETLQGKRFQK